MIRKAHVIQAGIALFAFMSIGALCGGSSDSSQGVITTSGSGGTGGSVTMSGVVSKGPVSNCTVRIYEFANSTRGALLSTTTTDSAGAFTISLANHSQFSGALLFEATTGTYTSELTGASSSLNWTMTSCIAVHNGQVLFQTGTSSTIAITPLSMMAVQLMAQRRLMNPALSDSAALALANQTVAGVFGIPDVVFTDPRPGRSNDTYALITASLLNQSATLGIPLPDLLTAYALDFADGIRDGRDSVGHTVTIPGTAVTMTDTFLTNLATTQLRAAILLLRQHFPTVKVDSSAVAIHTDTTLPTTVPGTSSSLSAGEWTLMARDLIARWSFVAADTALRYALAADPNNADANLFYALNTLPAYCEEEYAGGVAGVIKTPRDLCDAFGMTSSGQRSWLKAALGDTFNYPLTYKASHPAPSKIQAFVRSGLLPRLDGAISAIDKVPTTYQGTITSKEVALFKLIGSHKIDSWAATQNWEVDGSDVLTFRALLRVLRSAFAYMAAFNLDANWTDMPFIAANTLAAYPNLLKVTDAGLLSQARSDLRTGAQYASSAITAILAETDAQADDIFGFTSVRTSDAQTLKTYMDRLATSLGGTAAVFDSSACAVGYNVDTIVASAIFSRDLRDFIPTLQADSRNIVTAVSADCLAAWKTVLPWAKQRDVEIITDFHKPKIVMVKKTPAGYLSAGTGYAFTVQYQDVGLAGIDPDALEVCLWAAWTTSWTVNGAAISSLPRCTRPPRHNMMDHVFAMHPNVGSLLTTVRTDTWLQGTLTYENIGADRYMTHCPIIRDRKGNSTSAWIFPSSFMIFP